MPALVILSPIERLVAWNLGSIDDAVAVALGHLHHRPLGLAELVVYHTGAVPERRPVEWAVTDVRGVPKRPWLEPSPGGRSRWRARSEVLDSVVFASPPGPVDLIVSGHPDGGTEATPDALGAVRRDGYLFRADPARGAAPPASEWAPADDTGCLYRKLTPSTARGRCPSDGDGTVTTLARLHEQAVLVESYTSLALSLAHRFRYRGERVEDLEQVALLALVKAAGRYEPERARPFGPFAAACVVGELKRHFRDKIWTVRVPRSVQEMHLAIRAARDELTQTEGSSPTIGQIANRLDTTEEAVLTAMEAAANSWATSLDAPPQEGDGAVTEIPVVDTGFDQVLDRRVLKESIGYLSPTERLVVKRVFFEGRSQRQVAAELHVSQMQVSRLMAKALAKMRRVFQPA